MTPIARLVALSAGAGLIILATGAGLAQTTGVLKLKSDAYRRLDHFLTLPVGRTMGSTSAVTVDQRGHIWVADRCGANSCATSSLDPIMEFDALGQFVQAFGAGLFVFPHGIFVDGADHVWVTDAKSAEGKGNDVLEFDRHGKLLRTLAKTGGAAVSFHLPSAVLVAPNGDIFVADGHDTGESHARIMKFDPGGRLIGQWGTNGSAPGQFDMPHAIAMDSKGRLFVGDRGNNRVQVFAQDGRLIAIWPQFGRPSGVWVDHHDVLYVSDSESRNAPGYGHHPGWPRGIRIGRATDGIVTGFIRDTAPDPEHEDTTGGEGVTADADGNIFSAAVKEQDVIKFVMN